MEKTTLLEIPQEDAIRLEEQLARLVERMKDTHEEHEARQIRIAQYSAETEQSLLAIRRSLANVEKYHSVPLVPFHVQRKVC